MTPLVLDNRLMHNERSQTTAKQCMTISKPCPQEKARQTKDVSLATAQNESQMPQDHPSSLFIQFSPQQVISICSGLSHSIFPSVACYHLFNFLIHSSSNTLSHYSHRSFTLGCTYWSHSVPRKVSSLVNNQTFKNPWLIKVSIEPGQCVDLAS